MSTWDKVKAWFIAHWKPFLAAIAGILTLGFSYKLLKPGVSDAEKAAAELKGKAEAFEEAAKAQEEVIASSRVDVTASLVEFAAAAKVEEVAIKVMADVESQSKAATAAAGEDVDALARLLGSSK